MNNKKIMQARKRGMSNTEIAYLQNLAKKEAERVEKEYTEKALLYMLAIPLNVLVNDYWSKTAKTKAPKFIEDVFSLYESVQAGLVSNEELADLLKEYAGVTVEAEWLKRGNKDAE